MPPLNKEKRGRSLSLSIRKRFREEDTSGGLKGGEGESRTSVSSVEAPFHAEGVEDSKVEPCESERPVETDGSVERGESQAIIFSLEKEALLGEALFNISLGPGIAPGVYVSVFVNTFHFFVAILTKFNTNKELKISSFDNSGYDILPLNDLVTTLILHAKNGEVESAVS